MRPPSESASEVPPRAATMAPAAEPPVCCPRYHEAVELVGRRWTGAILAVLLEGGPMRFGEIGAAVPDLSDRLLSERLKDLEARGMVRRELDPGPPPRATYTLTEMGAGLGPALGALKAWAHRWL